MVWFNLVSFEYDERNGGKGEVHRGRQALRIMSLEGGTSTLIKASHGQDRHRLSSASVESIPPFNKYYRVPSYLSSTAVGKAAMGKTGESLPLCIILVRGRPIKNNVFFKKQIVLK